ncbi:MAG: site-specific integrase [Candidatus Sulfotelmatobacter sp.]
MNSNDLNFQLDTYLGLRRALGYGRSVWEAKLLRQLADFGGSQTPETPITSQLVLDWLDSNFRDSSPSLNARRLDAVRQFLTYLSAAVPGAEIPELRLFARYPRPKPFLFSPGEIESILHAAIASWQKGSLLPFTLQTVLGLLACTGLRAGEALALDLVDVVLDVKPARLCIREAKFHKTRLVPLHPTAVMHLTAYARQRAKVGGAVPPSLSRTTASASATKPYGAAYNGCFSNSAWPNVRAAAGPLSIPFATALPLHA